VHNKCPRYISVESRAPNDMALPAKKSAVCSRNVAMQLPSSLLDIIACFLGPGQSTLRQVCTSYHSPTVCLVHVSWILHAQLKERLDATWVRSLTIGFFELLREIALNNRLFPRLEKLTCSLNVYWSQNLKTVLNTLHKLTARRPVLKYVEILIQEDNWSGDMRLIKNLDEYRTLWARLQSRTGELAIQIELVNLCSGHVEVTCPSYPRHWEGN
jgi:hypothetical protein